MLNEFSYRPFDAREVKRAYSKWQKYGHYDPQCPLNKKVIKLDVNNAFLEPDTIENPKVVKKIINKNPYPNQPFT